ncbi:hypothetical protein [Francisella philomiragia]|nr:hypothetical protein [Francisella philomiragia]
MQKSIKFWKVKPLSPANPQQVTLLAITTSSDNELAIANIYF